MSYIFYPILANININIYNIYIPAINLGNIPDIPDSLGAQGLDIGQSSRTHLGQI